MNQKFSPGGEKLRDNVFTPDMYFLLEEAILGMSNVCWFFNKLIDLVSLGQNWR